MAFTRKKVGVDKIIIIVSLLVCFLHGIYPEMGGMEKIFSIGYLIAQLLYVIYQKKGRSSKDYYNKFPLSMITPLHLPGKRSE